MKNVSISLTGIIFLAISACTKAVDISAEKVAIEKVLVNYVVSVENEDMELYTRNVVHDKAMVNYGAFGNPIVGWDALKKVIEDQNTMLSEIKIDVSDLKIHVYETGKFAWATCLWSFKALMAENPIVLAVRCTWVLEKREPGWVIIHFHKSVPVS